MNSDNRRVAFMAKRVSFVLILGLILIFLGCNEFSQPPSPQDADAFLNTNRQDMDIIADFLIHIDTEHDLVFIDRDKTTVFFEFKQNDILSEDAKDALKRLRHAGCGSISLHKRDNTISFMIWSRTMGSVDCNIARTLDGEGLPVVQFQTECIPISDGWYYCYADYEAYRINPSKYDEMWIAQ